VEGCGDSCQTIQEHYIANILDSLNLNYGQRLHAHIDEVEDGYLGSHQYYYSWDFFVEEMGLLIQADGANGHGTKYSFSDDLFQCARFDFLKNILHIEVETEEEIREVIMRAFSNMEDS